jgi:hypothetical protein
MKTLEDIKSTDHIKGTLDKIKKRRQLPRFNSKVKGTFDRVTKE